MTRCFLLCLVLAAGAAPAAPRIAVHGHRGAPAARPENTIASFEEAIRGGADYIELDVYASRDNVLVVTHDPAINPAICQGGEAKRPVRSLTLAELRRYDCGSLRHPAFPRQQPVPGAKIPTLDEVFDLARTYPAVRFNIEIKSSAQWKDYTPEPAEYCEMVAAAIRRRGLEKRVFVQSFDFRIVTAMRKTAPEFVVAALYGSGGLSFVDIARETGVKVVTPHFKLVTPAKVGEAHAAGIQIVPWTVDTAGEWDRLIGAGVDGIITNDPAGLAAHLKARGLR
ncbi:MAG: glycerophosphodiester phosphodiesterase [Bryobacterales bacterium]|nr:glycerophosphodiester phosphodiesterase [Bryobacterales bacterium]